MGEATGGGRSRMVAAEEDARVMEWEEGLPCADELTPLSQPLITPELASAFGITPEPTRTILDVHRASHETLAALRCGRTGEGAVQRKLSSTGQAVAAAAEREESEEEDGTLAKEDAATEDEFSQKEQKTSGGTTGLADEGDSASPQEEDQNVESSARSSKRPRLVWTPQLHKRFVDVIAHLGIKNAVPKTIMQLMNVEGLTRENVASHLQKYRLYLKRMQGLSSEGPSPSDQLFASTPVPQSLRETPAVPVPMPYPTPLPGMLPMPVYGMAQLGIGGPMRTMPANGSHSSGHYHGFPNHHPYPMFGQLADWPGRNKFGPVTSYPNVSPGDK